MSFGEASDATTGIVTAPTVFAAGYAGAATCCRRQFQLLDFNQVALFDKTEHSSQCIKLGSDGEKTNHAPTNWVALSHETSFYRVQSR